MTALAMQNKGENLALPFVPFTFDTVLFTNLAHDLGYDLTWDQVDELWEAYKAGRASGEIPKPGNTPEAARYMSAATWWRVGTAQEWLNTADAAAKSWWGFGGYLEDFGRPSLILSTIPKAVGEAVTKVGRNIVQGVSEGLGVPKWLLGIVIFLAAIIVLFVVVKAYSPKLAVT